MADRRYIHPTTGEITEDIEPRPFDEFIRELGEGSTNSELSEGLTPPLARADTHRPPGHPTTFLERTT